MKVLPRVELERSLQRDIKPLYLLLGSERYLRGVAAQRIADAALSDSLLREFNESSFTLINDDIRSAIAAAEQLPMMSSRRVVKIRDFGKIKVDDEQVLMAYLKNPAPSTVMILIADDLDKRKASSKVMLDTCQVVDFSPIKDSEAKTWCKTRLTELSIKADDAVINELVRLVGTDVQTLSMELDKLSAAAVGTKKITLELVDDLVGRSRELSNFDLGDHLLAKNRKLALETLHRLLEDGAEPVMLVGLIASNYHKLALGKYLLARGGSNEVFRHIALPPFKRENYLRMLQNSDATKVARGLQLIAAVDLAIKTSQATPKLQLEMLVCELAG